MHPAIVAQASATMAAMYPGRHWLGLGSGEALNEHVVAGYWPETPDRINRMFEAIEIIKKLFGSRDRDVKHDGKFFKLEATRLWTLPDEPPPVYIATAGPVTAKKTGMYAEGLITVGAPEGKLEMIREKCEEGCRDAGKDPAAFKYILQLHLSWADTDEQALQNAMTEWPNGGMKFPKQDIRSPLDFEQMAKLVRAEDFEGRMLISSDPEKHRQQIQRFLDLGFDQIYLHNVGRNQAEWIECFGREVLPKLTA
jgi:G6PDH family F420-dependent oxidoreductase